ncbi:DUF7668 domain-containing protein [Rhizocola hellebori]|uniref:DUF7668 domain-containing protein n=1 Tax=Rhizocola hellebori TaxID=1392758 RepID=UPI004032A2F8
MSSKQTSRCPGRARSLRAAPSGHGRTTSPGSSASPSRASRASSGHAGLRACPDGPRRRAVRRRPAQRKCLGSPAMAPHAEPQRRNRLGGPGQARSPRTPPAAMRIGCLEAKREAWDTSVALWFGDRWRCLVDLWTKEEGRSDLVLDVDVFENGSGYRFYVNLVLVP